MQALEITESSLLNILSTFNYTEFFCIKNMKNCVKVIGLETHALWCTCTYFAQLGYGFLDMSG